VETSPASWQNAFWNDYGDAADAGDEDDGSSSGRGHWERGTAEDAAAGIVNKNGMVWVDD
jgi:hypothetical protein